MKKTFEINNLLDFYGRLLSQRQSDAMKMYYREDYSLNEIAEDLDISKQGVSDLIKRSENNLYHFEETLHLLEKNSEQMKRNQRIDESLLQLKAQLEEDYLKESVEEIRKLLK